MSSRQRRTRRFIAIGAQVIRAFLLLSVILAAATLLIWLNGHPLINQLGNKIVAGYEERYRAENRAAESLMHESKYPEAELVLLNLLESMGEVRRMDRLELTYMQALWLLRTVYDAQEKRELALDASKALVEFDPKSPKGWFAYAKTLDQNGRRDEAIDALYRAYRITPYTIEIAASLAKVLHDEDKKLEAKKVLQGYLDANRNGDLVLYYASEKEDLSAERISRLSLMALTEEKQAVAINIEQSGIAKIRLYFPEAPGVNLKLSSLALVTPMGKITVDLDAARAELNNMVAIGRNSFVITGPNPYIYFLIPPKFWDTKIEALEAELEFYRQLPPDLLYIMRDA